jgi:hypothetical protein
MCLALLTWPHQGAAQRPDSADQAVGVFLDCNAHNCDSDHFTREIAWVNWMRDRRDADLHLLVTAQETGGGGWHYTLDYIGQRSFEGIRKSLAYISDPDDTDTEVRDGLTRVLALGLVQFVETTAVAPRLEVVYRAPEIPLIGRHERDPWHLWVVTLSAFGSLEGEALQSAHSIEGWANADRVAEDLKINLRIGGEYDYEEFTIIEVSDSASDTTQATNRQEDYAARGLIVWSLGEHWSAGGTASAIRSTFLNQDLTLAAGPAIEFNIFPYRESTRRSLAFRYALEMARFHYLDSAGVYEGDSVVGKKAGEVLPRHSLVIEATIRQPWGQIDGSVQGIQYLNDPAAHRVNAFLSFEYRLFRGLNLDLFGRFSRIKDQFYLPASGFSEEDILLERRQRETDYQFDIGIGFSYRFGSKFANIVNPRFGTGGDE